jgi:methylated-DNA-[protein]-cysteine S-methyltransferase
MQKVTKYTIFKTKWGYFGLAGNENGILRTCLPFSNPENVKSRLLSMLEAPKFEKCFFKTVQEQIIAYFEGDCINFNRDIPLMLNGFSDFCSSVLTTCRGIKFGQVVTYSELAKKMGQPAASQAVGNALAKNPLPLIIPCHRIIRSDGQLGGFSAPGGMNTKAKLLKHEWLVLRDSKIK